MKYNVLKPHLTINDDPFWEHADELELYYMPAKIAIYLNMESVTDYTDKPNNYEVCFIRKDNNQKIIAIYEIDNNELITARDWRVKNENKLLNNPKLTIDATKIFETELEFKYPNSTEIIALKAVYYVAEFDSNYQIIPGSPNIKPSIVEGHRTSDYTIRYIGFNAKGIKINSETRWTTLADNKLQLKSWGYDIERGIANEEIKTGDLIIQDENGNFTTQSTDPIKINDWIMNVPEKFEFPDEWTMEFPVTPSISQEFRIPVCPDCRGKKIYQPLMGPSESCKSCNGKGTI